MWWLVAVAASNNIYMHTTWKGIAFVNFAVNSIVSRAIVKDVFEWGAYYYLNTINLNINHSINLNEYLEIKRLATIYDFCILIHWICFAAVAADVW